MHSLLIAGASSQKVLETLKSALAHKDRSTDTWPPPGGDIPGSPVAKTMPFSAGHVGSAPGWRV